MTESHCLDCFLLAFAFEYVLIPVVHGEAEEFDCTTSHEQSTAAKQLLISFLPALLFFPAQPAPPLSLAHFLSEVPSTNTRTLRR